ncbi:hypothetical protein K9L27_01255 [Candidatus Gracilibacteria bacterium]|nr:hypothetical protein [Candidatus Gracilibacteria bacterium]
MKFLKITLTPSDTIGNIVEIFGKTEAKKIIFLCPRNFSLLSDMAFLKKLREEALIHHKKIAFISLQKFARDVLKRQQFEVYSKIVKDYEEGEEKTVKDFGDTLEATKNILKEEPIEKPIAKSTEKPKFETHKIQNPEESKPIQGKVFFGFLAVILILIGLWLWVSPQVVITLKPKVSVVPITQNVLVTFPETIVREQDKFLPQIQGIFVQTEVAGTEVFPSTGRKYDLTNAKGKVTIFNETSKPKFFIPSRLSTADGVIFRFTQNITIPPKDEKGAGRLVVDIVADEYDENGKPIGERGNIDAGTDLIFPALGSVAQELYYAKANQGPLVGGSTLTHYFIQEGDFEGVKNTLVESFRVRGIEYLENEIRNRSEREGKRYVLLDDPRLLSHELLEATFPNYVVGQETQTFEVQAKLKLSGIVFDQKQVSDFLEEKLKQTQDHRKKLINIDQTSASYRVLESEKLEEEKWVKLSVEMQGVEMLDIDSGSDEANEWQQSIKKEIAGKSISEAKSILINFPEIEYVGNIKISPFWSEQVPSNFNQIEFKIQRAE